MDQISVVIPCYNDGMYLKDAIQSVFRQTYPHWEIIVVNDGSNDLFTLNYLYSINHPRIKVLHKTNGRMSSARNYGIKHSANPTIVTLDADDKFSSTFFEKAIRVLETKPEVGVVTCYLKSFGLKKYRWRPAGGGIQNLLYRQECCASAMFRKQCWEDTGGYDEKMVHGYEDWEFWIRVTEKGWTIKVLKEFLLHYRVTKKSTFLNSSEPRRQELIDYITKKHKSLYSQYLTSGIDHKSIIDLNANNIFMILLKYFYWKQVKGKFLRRLIP